MEITEEEIEEKEESVRIPNDAGPNAKLNGWASAPIPGPPPQKVQFLKMRIMNLLLMGESGLDGNNSAPRQKDKSRGRKNPLAP